jgi:hypothetical protein
MSTRRIIPVGRRWRWRWRLRVLARVSEWATGRSGVSANFWSPKKLRLRGEASHAFGRLPESLSCQAYRLGTLFLDSEASKELFHERAYMLRLA